MRKVERSLHREESFSTTARVPADLSSALTFRSDILKPGEVVSAFPTIRCTSTANCLDSQVIRGISHHKVLPCHVLRTRPGQICPRIRVKPEHYKKLGYLCRPVRDHSCISVHIDRTHAIYVRIFRSNGTRGFWRFST